MEDASTLNARVDINTSSDENRCDENEVNEHTLDGKGKIEEPKLGMVFSSQEDGYQYYTNYARQEGFGVMRRSSGCGDDGIMRYFTFTCARARKPKSTNNSFKPHLSTKTECPAKLRLTLQPDGMFKLTTVVLEHNHTLSPGKVLLFRCNKRLEQQVKRRLEVNDQSVISVDTNFNSVVVEARGSNEDWCDENEVNEHTLDGKGKIEEPKLGMVFSSQEDGYQYYTNYARQEGFGVTRRSSRCGDDGIMRYFTFSCARARKPKSTNNSFKPHLSTKTECPAKLRLTLQSDEMFKLTTVVLEHNHTLSPGEVRFFRCNKRLKQHGKRRRELNDQVGIHVGKNFNSFVVEAGGYENPPFCEKDCRNYVEKARRLRPGVGDAEAIRTYFVKMQDKNSNFFYTMDLDEDFRVRNLFWADARSRATYEAFGDVVTFDTMYLTNKYDMPFAPFVGVNHHGQSVLLGCSLLSNEDTETFVWLFESWLACMSWCPPKAIITNQCKAIQRAVERVFPDTRHRWCLWQIMKRIPDKLKGYSQYESIKTALQAVVYDSFTKNEFEEGWREMINKYDLHDNEWLGWLYDDRHRWVPIYVKDTFWAGMSTTQHSESMNSFFGEYVNPKTTLKQFVEQYDNALRSKVEKENLADYHSFNSRYDCVTDYDIEKQFQGAYTNAKFKEFQEELKGKLYCYPSIVKEEGSICIYKVAQDVKIGNKRKDVVFDVYFNEVECEVKCMCHLFEFRGIICRHSLSVLTQRKVEEVPPNYILSRWRKDLQRKYIFIKSSYNDLGVKLHAQRYDKMLKECHEVAAIASDFEERCNIVSSSMRTLKDQFLSDDSMCGSNQFTQVESVALPNCADDNNGISKVDSKVLSPLVVQHKGHPISKRIVSKVEQVVRRLKERKKKQQVEENNTKKPKRKKGSHVQGVKRGGSDEAPPTSNTPHMVNEIRTQETLNLLANPASYVVGTQESVNIMANPGSFLGGSYVVAPSALNQSQGHLTQVWRGGNGMENLTLLESLSGEI